MEEIFRSQFRLPIELADRLRESAEASGRSLNAEVVARLERSFKNVAPGDLQNLQEIEKRMNGVEQHLDHLERQLELVRAIRMGIGAPDPTKS